MMSRVVKLSFLIGVVVAFLFLPFGCKSYGISQEGAKILEGLNIELERTDSIEYFSTGVGKETREVEYPPFSLRLVFATTEGNYLANVAVTIRDQYGRQVLNTIATGPWFYVDLATGTYAIELTARDEKKLLKGVDVQKGMTKTRLVHWRYD